MNAPQIIPAAIKDWPDIWPVVHAVIAAGETYTYNPNWTADEARGYWFAPEKTIYKAVLNDQVVGTYYLRRNFGEGPADHIANAGFMVHPEYRGHGVGRLMGGHALQEARRQGYTAMQFNFVVSTNTGAIRLWESLGFVILGTIPAAYRHASAGVVSAHIMYRSLVQGDATGAQ